MTVWPGRPGISGKEKATHECHARYSGSSRPLRIAANRIYEQNPGFLNYAPAFAVALS